MKALALELAKPTKLSRSKLTDALAFAMAFAQSDPDTVRKDEAIELGAYTEKNLRRIAIWLEVGQSQPRPMDVWFEKSIEEDIKLLRHLLTAHYGTL